MTKRWLEWDKAQSCCSAERLHAIANLELFVNIAQVEINCSLRDEEPISSFLAAVALCDQT